MSGEIAVYAYGKGQISNLWNQDVSKEILLDLVRKDIAEFTDKFSRFQYATLKMFRAALNNYSMLKLHFLKSTPTLLQCIVKTSPISIMQLIRTPPNHIFIVELPQNEGRSVSIFFYSPQLLSLRSLFSFGR